MQPLGRSSAWTSTQTSDLKQIDQTLVRCEQEQGLAGVDYNIKPSTEGAILFQRRMRLLMNKERPESFGHHLDHLDYRVAEIAASTFRRRHNQRKPEKKTLIKPEVKVAKPEPRVARNEVIQNSIMSNILHESTKAAVQMVKPHSKPAKPQFDFLNETFNGKLAK